MWLVDLEAPIRRLDTEAGQRTMLIRPILELEPYFRVS